MALVHGTVQDISTDVTLAESKSKIDGNFEDLLENDVDLDERLEVLESNVINVCAEPYNAVGNGIANDSTAIQSAIDDASDWDIIYLPAGKTFKADGLVIDNKVGIQFYCDGVLQADSNDVLTIGSSSTTEPTRLRIYIRKLIGAGKSPTGKDGIVHKSGRYMTVEIDSLSGFRYGYYVSPIANVGNFNCADCKVNIRALTSCYQGVRHEAGPYTPIISEGYWFNFGLVGQCDKGYVRVSPDDTYNPPGVEAKSSNRYGIVVGAFDFNDTLDIEDNTESSYSIYDINFANPLQAFAGIGFKESQVRVANKGIQYFYNLRWGYAPSSNVTTLKKRKNDDSGDLDLIYFNHNESDDWNIDFKNNKVKNLVFNPTGASLDGAIRVQDAANGRAVEFYNEGRGEWGALSPKFDGSGVIPSTTFTGFNALNLVQYRVQGNGGAKVCTSMDDGLYNGQELFIIGTSDTNTVTLTTSISNLTIPNNRIFANGSTGHYMWNSTISKWVEISFNGSASKLMFTNEGGLAIKLTNKTGSASVKGSVVSAASSADNAFILQANEYDAIGVVYENGIADASECWVVVSGIAEVLLKDTTASTRGNWVKCADTDGRADASGAVPSPATDDNHFKEIGHCLETKGSGTNVLAKCILHFN